MAKKTRSAKERDGKVGCYGDLQVEKSFGVKSTEQYIFAYYALSSCGSEGKLEY